MISYCKVQYGIILYVIVLCGIIWYVSATMLKNVGSIIWQNAGIIIWQKAVDTILQIAGKILISYYVLQYGMVYDVIVWFGIIWYGSATMLKKLYYIFWQIAGVIIWLKADATIWQNAGNIMISMLLQLYCKTS